MSAVNLMGPDVGWMRAEWQQARTMQKLKGDPPAPLPYARLMRKTRPSSSAESSNPMRCASW